jgi:hypothetical protein
MHGGHKSRWYWGCYIPRGVVPTGDDSQSDQRYTTRSLTAPSGSKTSGSVCARAGGRGVPTPLSTWSIERHVARGNPPWNARPRHQQCEWNEWSFTSSTVLSTCAVHSTRIGSAPRASVGTSPSQATSRPSVPLPVRLQVHGPARLDAFAAQTWRNRTSDQCKLNPAPRPPGTQAGRASC